MTDDADLAVTVKLYEPAGVPGTCRGEVVLVPVPPPPPHPDSETTTTKTSDSPPAIASTKRLGFMRFFLAALTPSPVEEFLCWHVDLSLEEATSGMTNDVGIRVLGRQGVRTLLNQVLLMVSAGMERP